ncbi:MAG TPA: YceD family protein [Gammaproteobacteria bacterium]
MSGALPPSLDLARAARQTYGLEGRLPVRSLPRLAAVLASDRGEVKVALEAGKDAARQVTVTGRIDAELELTCQRCLEPVKLAVHAEPNLAWVKSDEQLAGLSEEYEPLLSADGDVDLKELVADELLLALPLVPRHEGDTACGELPGHAAQAAEPVEKKNPFAELAKLKRGQ